MICTKNQTGFELNILQSSCLFSFLLSVKLQNLRSRLVLRGFIFLFFILLFSCTPQKAEPPAALITETNWFSGHENDAARFAEIFPVSADNPFIFASYDELITHLKYGTGVIAFAFPACPRCKNAFPVLERVFKETEMTRYAGLRGKILYYDIYDDREANNERYLTIVEYLKDFLPLDQNGKPRIYSPDIYFLASGKIVGNHLDTVPSLANPRDPLNEEQEAELFTIYKELIEKVEDCGC